MRPNYGSKKQLATPLDTSPPIPEECKRRIQKIVGKFLYYFHAVYCNILPSLNTISYQQLNPTQSTEVVITHFLYYAATNTTAIVQYKDIGMIIRIDWDASYFSKPWARRRTGGSYYLSLLPANPEKDPNLPTPVNVPIHR